eukprot:1515493-Ditylum_brightwellii.AAC.1
MVEEGPWPVLAWEIPSKEAIAEWSGERKCASTMMGRTGWKAYLKEKCDDYVRINFVEELA